MKVHLNLKLFRDTAYLRKCVPAPSRLKKIIIIRIPTSPISGFDRFSNKLLVEMVKK